MKPSDTGRAYDQIAERWSSDEFPRSNGVGPHERAIAFVAERDERWALDVGCGCSGRFIDLLMRHNFNVEGIDISRRMVELARARHPTVTIHHADVCEWVFPRQYDLISAWDSIWHVPLAEQERVLRKILANLTPGGICIFTTGGTDEPGEMLDSYMGPDLYYSGLGLRKTLETMHDSGCVCRHLEYDQHPELHVYLIAQRGRPVTRTDSAQVTNSTAGLERTGKDGRTHTSPILRAALREDIPAMHRVRLSVRENRLESIVIGEADYVAAIEETGRGWVVEVGGEVVGFAVGNARDGSIWALFVHPDHERRGYGRQLHDAVVRWLRSAGFDVLWLTTQPGTRAERFYAAAGWSHAGRTERGEIRYEMRRVPPPS